MSHRRADGAPDVLLVETLALRLRERVLPHLGAHAGRAHAGLGTGGDVTFAIDAEAEAELESWVAEHAPGVAFYSEDRGLVEPAGVAEHVLVVDPVDGTRPAMAGFEAACVSVALAPLGGRGPTMGDVTAGCVVEIKSGARFVARRGAGVRATAPLRLSATTDLARLFLAYGFRGRPARPTTEVLAPLIDGCLAGGAFNLGSATYDLTRIITGQLDAYVEPGARLVHEVPGLRAEFERAGGGRILNNSPYDLAAAVLCLEEGRAIVTDASGRSLHDRPLLGSGPDFQMSCVAASNQELHRKLLQMVEEGIDRLKSGHATPTGLPGKA